MKNALRTIRRVCLTFLAVYGFVGQTQAAAPADLVFLIRPSMPSFELNTDITIEFTLKNTSAHRILVTREASLHDLVYLDVFDERGERVGWRGQIVSRGYPSNFFLILDPGQSTTFRSVIATADGAGYQITKPGNYRIQAVFSLAPKEYFAPLSHGAAIPEPAKSNWARFSVKPRSSSKEEGAQHDRKD